MATHTVTLRADSRVDSELQFILPDFWSTRPDSRGGAYWRIFTVILHSPPRNRGDSTARHGASSSSTKGSPGQHVDGVVYETVVDGEDVVRRGDVETPPALAEEPHPHSVARRDFEDPDTPADFGTILGTVPS